MLFLKNRELIDVSIFLQWQQQASATFLNSKISLKWKELTKYSNSSKILHFSWVKLLMLPSMCQAELTLINHLSLQVESMGLVCCPIHPLYIQVQTLVLSFMGLLLLTASLMVFFTKCVESIQQMLFLVFKWRRWLQIQTVLPLNVTRGTRSYFPKENGLCYQNRHRLQNTFAFKFYFKCHAAYDKAHIHTHPHGIYISLQKKFHESLVKEI